MGDQAAGLRQWAAEAGRQETPEVQTSHGDSAPAATTPLMVIGLPGRSARQTERVEETLRYWAEQGWRWVGSPEAWKVVPVESTSPHLPLLISQQRHWGLWVDRDAEAFRRAYRALKRLAASSGPRRLLALHPPEIGRRGLLDNLRQVAATDLGIDLVVLAT